MAEKVGFEDIIPEGAGINDPRTVVLEQWHKCRTVANLPQADLQQAFYELYGKDVEPELLEALSVACAS